MGRKSIAMPSRKNGTLHPTRTRTVLVLCLLGAGVAIRLCVDGFIFVRRVPQFMHRSLSFGKQPTGTAMMLVKTDQDVLYEDEYSDTIYPTDTLKNIGINSTLTMAPDIAYFYLQNTLGLSEETMWKITLEAGSVLGMTPRNLEKKVSLLRRTMNLSDEDVRIMLGKQPALLHYSADRNLAPTILFLVRALDLSKSDLRSMIMDCPSILGYSLGNLKKKIAFFAFTLGYDDIDSIRELLVGTPKLLLSAVDTGLVPRMRFLLNEIQFTVDELQILYQKNPKLLLYSLDDNLREKIVFFFILQLHMEPEHVRKVLLSFPQVMDYNLENHMKPIAEYFMTELEFSAAELGSIIVKFPRLFSYSLFKIKHVTGFLRYELELGPRQAKRVIFQAPQLIGLDTEGNLKEKIDFIKNRLRLTAGEFGDVFSKMPTMMCLGIQNNLLPKLDYLEEALEDKVHSNNHLLLKETILKQPTLLGYSLPGRIKPRMEQLVAAGISPNKISVGISMSEESFQQWLSSSEARKSAHSIIAKRNFTAAGVLLKDLEFSEEDINKICSELPEINDWAVPSLQSWISYMKEKLNVSEIELKNALLSCPSLLDSSSRGKVRRRIKRLRTIDLSLLDDLDTMYLSDREFDAWFSQKQKKYKSKIAYLQRELRLSKIEIGALLSEVPTLENTQANAVFQQKMNYFISHLNNSTEEVKTMLLGNPSLLDLPLKKSIEPRMQKIMSAGVSDPQTISHLLALDDDHYLKNITLSTLRSQFPERIGYLESTLQLNRENADSLVLSLSSALLAGERVEGSLALLLSIANDDVDRVRDAVLERPDLLSFSSTELNDLVDERRALLTTEDMISTLTMSDEVYQTHLYEINRRVEIQSQLNLTDSELDSLLPMEAWLGQCHLRQIEPTIQYLASQINCSNSDLKLLLLQERRLLTLSLSKTIQPRMDMLLESGCPATDISKVVVLTPRKAREHCLKCILRRNLGLSSNQLNNLFTSVGSRQSVGSLTEKVDYLMQHVFSGSKRRMKAAVLQNPTLLKQSLSEIIQPRMEVLRYLESVGLGYHPGDIVSFLTQSDSSFMKEMVPQMKSWHPPVSRIELDGRFKGDATGKRFESEQDHILATLRDFSSPVALAYSDESNREGAKVVHWR